MLLPRPITYEVVRNCSNCDLFSRNWKCPEISILTNRSANNDVKTLLMRRSAFHEGLFSLRHATVEIGLSVRFCSFQLDKKNIAGCSNGQRTILAMSH